MSLRGKGSSSKHGRNIQVFSSYNFKLHNEYFFTLESNNPLEDPKRGRISDYKWFRGYIIIIHEGLI